MGCQSFSSDWSHASVLQITPCFNAYLRLHHVDSIWQTILLMHVKTSRNFGARRGARAGSLGFSRRAWQSRLPADQPVGKNADVRHRRAKRGQRDAFKECGFPQAVVAQQQIQIGSRGLRILRLANFRPG